MSGGGGGGAGKDFFRNINEQKLKSFSIGTMGKRGPTKKEQEELRKKHDEEEVGKVYREFVSTFDDSPSSKIGKTFVKAGTFNAGNRKEDTSDKGKLYKPSSRLDLGSKSRVEPKTPDLGLKRPEKPGSKKKEKEKKKSNLEMFKEELKARQEERQERHRVKSAIKSGGAFREDGPRNCGGGGGGGGGLAEETLKPFLSEPSGPGSHDTGDPTTTNVYLGNLSPKLTEQELMEMFGKYGPLASIKIMWPRTEDEKARGRNCGFVAYMARCDAERAMKYLLGKMVEGFEMKMGWGKPVPIPLHPIYVPPSLMKLMMPPDPSGLPFNCQQNSKVDEGKAKGMEKLEADAFNRLLRRSLVKVSVPTDRTQLCLINRMAEFVIREGPMFEAMVMNRELNNRVFKFLFENQGPEHIYYRWRLYSLMQGDAKDEWRIEEFQMFKGGSIWKPPTMSIFSQGMPEELVEKELSGGSGGGGEDKDKGRKAKKQKADRGGLSNSQRDRFEDMLRNLTPDRNPIAETMVWCIEHAEAGEEIVDCIAESLSLQQTPLAKKIARLYLISDILHNCSVKGVTNVSYFRKGFQVKLPDVFGDLNACYKAIEARIRAEAFRQRVLSCFRAWEDWALYPQDFLIRLQNIFLGLVGGGSADSDEGDVTPGRNNSDDVDGKSMNSDDDDDDVDGVPLDGAALLKKAQKGNLNDMANKPVRASSSSSVQVSKNSLPAGFVPSKWESVDQKTVESQAVTSKWDIFDHQEEKQIKSVTEPDDDDDDDDIDGVPLQDDVDNSEHDVGMSEDRRARLREIEMKVMSFQDELESGKQPSKPGWTISEQVEQYRKKLMKRSDPDDGRGSTTPVIQPGEDCYSSDEDRGRPSRKSSKRSRSCRSASSGSSSSRSRSRSRERKKSRHKSSRKRPESPSSDSGSDSDRRSSKLKRSKSPRKHKKKRR